MKTFRGFLIGKEGVEMKLQEVYLLSGIRHDGRRNGAFAYPPQRTKDGAV